jgi:hypothetical protein
MAFFIITIVTTSALASTTLETTKDIKTFIEKLKDHYRNTRSIEKFSLSHHYLNRQYRSHDYWDYQIPNRIMAQRTVEIDLVKQHFFDNDIYYTAGGLLLDRAHFENDTESFAYEMNGGYLGKRIINQGKGQFFRMDYVLLNIDFLAVRPLLDESNIEKNIALHQNTKSGTTTLIHDTEDGNILAYEFSNIPLRLTSLDDKSKQAILTYENYQITNGLSYARTVHQYFDGVAEPYYSIYNDHFEVIEQVEPSKLKVPTGYGPIIPKADGVIVAKPIAKDLYLVTDSSAWRNSLFKVNGDEIMVFGASGYKALAEKTIKLINEQFPYKKISSVYITHPHGYEIDGLDIYANQGIEILADAYSIEAIKAYPKFPDSIANFKFRTISHGQIIDGARFYVLENMHSKRQSFVHFEDSEIIFQSKFLDIAFDNSIAKVIPNYTKTFVNFIRSKQLKFKRIVGNFKNNDISVEVMNKTYDAIL